MATVGSRSSRRRAANVLAASLHGSFVLCVFVEFFRRTMNNLPDAHLVLLPEVGVVIVSLRVCKHSSLAPLGPV